MSKSKIQILFYNYKFKIFWNNINMKETLKWEMSVKIIYILTNLRIASDFDFKTSCFMFRVSLWPCLTIWNLYFSQCTSTIFKTVNGVCFYSNFFGNSFVWIYYFVIAVAHKVYIRCFINKWHFLTVPFLCKLNGNKLLNGNVWINSVFENFWQSSKRD